MAESLIYRTATKDDDPLILELFRASFGRDMRADWWDWFSHKCPTGPNRTSVIEDPELGRLAGSYSLLPIRLWLNGREIQASLATNANTHPDYRRMGLFTKIGRYALSREREFGTPVSLGMPNQSAVPGHIKVGWEVPFALPFLVKKDCEVRPHSCTEVKAFDRRFDDFFDRIRRGFSFLVMKDHRFLNWRVVDRPDQSYTKIVCEDKGELRGYAVLKRFDENGYRKSHILDIQAESQDALRQLISAAESFSHGRDELNMWTNPHNPYQETFLREGFVERESSDKLIFHTNYGDKEKPQKGAWWFCLADNDVY